MPNLSDKIKELSFTFDEMIATWSANGYYIQSNCHQSFMTDLQVLKNIELFFLDIESIKNDLFILKARYIRNTYEKLDSINNPSELYIASHYAKKWFPFQFIFESHMYRNQVDSIKFFEISDRFEFFYHFFNFHLHKVIIENGVHTVLKTDSDDPLVIKNMYLFGEYGKLLQKIERVEDVPPEIASFINEIIVAYKAVLDSTRKVRNIDGSFSKKKREYTNYVKELLDQNGSLLAISINFYLNDELSQRECMNIKRKFLNSLRSIKNLNLFVGYLGTWEFSPIKNYYFRIVFFVPRHKLFRAQIFEDEIINYWNNFQYRNQDQIISPFLEAEVSNLSNSAKLLMKSHCILPHKQSHILETFIDTVINYSVLTEKFFYPMELQFLLYFHSKEENQIKNKDGHYIISSLKNTLSRSFRGHIRKKT